MAAMRFRSWPNDTRRVAPRGWDAAAAVACAVSMVGVVGCSDPAAMGDDAGGSSTATTTTAVTQATADGTAETSDDAPDQGSASVVAVDGWLLDESPPATLAADRPAAVECEFGWGVEDGVFEVDSGLCNWGAFVQPSLEPIGVGDEVEIVLLHDALYSEEEGAVAHLAVALGESLVWEQTLMIPAPPGFLRPAITVEAAFPEGTPVHLHAHNHGYNNYRVVDIIVTHR